MKIRIGFEITYDFVAPTPMMLMLNVHPSRAADIIKPDQLRVSPAVPFTRYLDAFGNVCTRLVAPPGQLDIRTDALVADSGLPDVVEPAAASTKSLSFRTTPWCSCWRADIARPSG